MADKILNTRIQLRHGTAAEWTAANPVLLLGEVGVETDTMRQKVGDGTKTWQQLSYQDKPVYDAIDERGNFTEVVPDDGETDIEAITRVVTDPFKGDISVVKRSFGDGQFSYTGYVYDGENWGAMDGNYNAENVYFNEDLTYTKAFGELPAVPSSGAATLDAKGKNVKQVLSTILAQRKQPTKSDPAVTLSGTQSSQDLEIGTTVSKSGTLGSSLSTGSYTYGPATGITAKTWSQEVKYTQGKSGSIATGTTASTAYSYSFTLGADEDGDTVKVYFNASATHDAGTVAKDNLGDASNPEVKIAAGTKSKDATATYTCYRKMFYGTRTDTSDLDSAKIRALTGEKAAKKASNSLTINIPVGAKRVVVALPSGYTLTSVKDVNDSSAEIISAFSDIRTVAVEGAESYTAANYTVYICDYANPATAANTYKATIA